MSDVYDELRDALRVALEALHARRFTSPAAVELPSGRLLVYRKRGGCWRLLVVSAEELDETKGVRVETASLADRVAAALALPELLAELEAAQAEQEERIRKAAEAARAFAERLSCRGS